MLLEVPIQQCSAFLLITRLHQFFVTNLLDIFMMMINGLLSSQWPIDSFLGWKLRSDILIKTLFLIQKICSTGYSLSEALSLASINPKYDNRLFNELWIQYKKDTSSVHIVYIKLFWTSKQKQFYVLKLVIQWTICCHILG